MKRQGNPIDDLFRESLSGARREPSAGLWSMLESRFFGSAGKMRFILFLSGALILISASLALYFRLDYPENSVIAGTAPGQSHENFIEKAVPVDRSSDELSLSGSVNDNYPGVPATGIKNINAYKDERGSKGTTENASSELLKKDFPTNVENKSSPVQSPVGEDKTIFNSAGTIAYLPGINSVWLDYNRSEKGRQLELSALESPGFEGIRMKDDYAIPSNLGFGAYVNPGITFYDPNPNKYFAGAEMTANFTLSKWLIQVGAGYHLMQDLGKYQVKYTTWDSVGFYREVTSFEFAKDNPDSIIIHYTKRTVYDSIENLSLSERNNRYSYLTLPLHLGYKIYENQVMTVRLKAGMVFSFLVAKNEPVVNVGLSDASQVSVEKVVPERVRTNWHYTLGVQLGFRLGNNTSLSVEPYYGQYLNPVYLNSTDWNGKRPRMFGIRTGIELNF